MEKNAVEILIPYLVEKGFVDFVVLEPQNDFNKAIVGFDEKQNRLIYSYEKIIDVHTEMFIEKDETDPNDEMSLHVAYDNAVEWVDFNTLRAIPYMGKYRPIIVFNNDDNEREEMDL
jgi:hypothetical protein